jgi:hypothetical protein
MNLPAAETKSSCFRHGAIMAGLKTDSSLQKTWVTPEGPLNPSFGNEAVLSGTDLASWIPVSTGLLLATAKDFNGKQMSSYTVYPDGLDPQRFITALAKNLALFPTFGGRLVKVNGVYKVCCPTNYQRD